MKLWAASAVATIAGIAIGGSCMYILMRAPEDADSQMRSGGYTYINPLLACDSSDDTPNANLSAIKDALSSKVNDLISNGKATRISVYVVDMNSGIWTGVNTTQRYAPASLLKVPLMIALLKESEASTTVLSTELTIPQGNDANANEKIKPANPLALGTNYPISTLMQSMIEDSDNNAMFAIIGAVSTSTLTDVFSQFSVPVEVTRTDNSVTPRDYFRFFSLLYNGTYLTHSDSQHALDLLTHVTYDAGLNAGTPDNVTVAHKFGEREFLNADGSTASVQLHDCGIVYYPHIPYGICVMTEGNDIATLQSDIRSISSAVYGAVAQGLMSAN